MRVEEIAQLQPDDIKIDEDIWIFDIRKSKTESGIRRVPIHSFILRHGICELAQSRRSYGFTQLFPDLTPSGPENKFSASYSREFSRLLRGMKINELVTFHSFRHTFRTKVASSKVLDRHLDAITGHENTTRSVGKIYEHREEFTLDNLREAVEIFVPPIDLSWMHDI